MFTPKELNTIFKFNIFYKKGFYNKSTNFREFTHNKFFIVTSSNPFIIDIWLLLEIFNKYNTGSIICLGILSNSFEKIQNLVNLLNISEYKIEILLIPENILNQSLKSNSAKNINEFIDNQELNIDKSSNLKSILEAHLENKLFLIPNLINYQSIKSFNKEKFKLNLGIIVHARMSSTRLPGKAMLEIAGEPVVLKILSRLANKFGKDKIILSTSTNKNDNGMASFIENNGFSVYRGEEENLADRFLDIAIDRNLSHIVRVTGDDLFRDFNSIELMLDKIITNNLDYIFSDDLILGCNSEIMNVESILFIQKFAKYPNQTNSLTWYLDRKDVFKIEEFNHDLHQRYAISLMLDEKKDYQTFLKLWHNNDKFFSSLWNYEELLTLITNNLNLFDFHPLDVGLFNRDEENFSFLFDH
tara:strand:- start:1279 stop:2523 length:1245 start_codon:yes stop_codon:yes gene_type:complete